MLKITKRDTLIQRNIYNSLKGIHAGLLSYSSLEGGRGALVAQTGVPNIDLVIKDTFTNFDLTFQWKVSKAGNSGVFYNVQEASANESGNRNNPNRLDNVEM